MDLKDLDLATGVDRVPEFWTRHGNKVLIGITVLALGYALWSFKRNSAVSARMTAESNLSMARELLMELRAFPLSGQSPERYSAMRRSALADATAYLNEVLGRTEEEGYVAQALLLRGDLNYTLSGMPELEAAATRPALGLGQKPDQLLGAAKESYTKLIATYPGRTREAGAAHLGLAAIAEDEGDFAGAKTHYEAVANDTAQMKSYRELAESRVKRLPELATPLRLRMSAATMPATTPAAELATVPAVTPSALPTTVPATMPAGTP